MQKILVIEDEDDIREEVIAWLKYEGFETASADNGQQGLLAVEHENPDLILCDIAMPTLDGHGVLTRLRNNPAYAHIPFIFLTASASHEAMRAGMELGADDYLTKPFSLAELLHAVHTRLEKKHQLDLQVQAHFEAMNAALDDQQKKLMLKSHLVAMFSHDFRNPLTSILTSSDIIRSYGSRLSDQQKEKHLDRIEGSVYLLLQMLDDMLMISEMESGHLKFNPETIDLHALIHTLIDDFRLITGESHQITLQEATLQTATVDATLFRRILTNLLSNAVKYSAPGSTVCITLAHTDSSLDITVEDHGIGIPANDLPHLFQPFKRAANAKNIRGTGLGLAIVKEAIELHNGSVKITSTEGVGTRIAVHLPLNP